MHGALFLPSWGMNPSWNTTTLSHFPPRGFHLSFFYLSGWNSERIAACHLWELPLTLSLFWSPLYLNEEKDLETNSFKSQTSIDREREFAGERGREREGRAIGREKFSSRRKPFPWRGDPSRERKTAGEREKERDKEREIRKERERETFAEEERKRRKRREKKREKGDVARRRKRGRGEERERKREQSGRRREVTGEGKELLATEKFPSREGRRERKRARKKERISGKREREGEGKRRRRGNREEKRGKKEEIGRLVLLAVASRPKQFPSRGDARRERGRWRRKKFSSSSPLRARGRMPGTMTEKASPSRILDKSQSLSQRLRGEQSSTGGVYLLQVRSGDYFRYSIAAFLLSWFL